MAAPTIPKHIQGIAYKTDMDTSAIPQKRVPLLYETFHFHPYINHHRGYFTKHERLNEPLENRIVPFNFRARVNVNCINVLCIRF